MQSENLELEDILILKGVHAKGYGIVGKIVMQDRRLHYAAKAIYSYFCSYAGAGSQAFPKVDKILYDLDMSRSTYYKYYRQLVQYGYIVVNQQKSATNQFMRNIYYLDPNPVSRVEEENTQIDEDKTEEIEQSEPSVKIQHTDETVDNTPCSKIQHTEKPCTKSPQSETPHTAKQTLKVTSIKSNIFKLSNNNSTKKPKSYFELYLEAKRQGVIDEPDPTYYYDWMNE